VSVRAKSTIVNDRNDDMRRAATKDVPQARENALSAKAQNRMTAKSRLAAVARYWNQGLVRGQS